MKTAQEYLDIIKAHQSELEERFGITSMRLFGSVARGEHHEGSDVDLFVTMPPKFYNYVLAAQDLEELLGLCRKVLVLRGGASAGFVEEKDLDEQHIIRKATGVEA